MNAFMFACYHGLLDVVKSFLKHKELELNVQDDIHFGFFITALICACENGHFDVAALLLEQDGIEVKDELRQLIQTGIQELNAFNQRMQQRYYFVEREEEEEEAEFEDDKIAYYG